jgi:serine protease
MRRLFLCATLVATCFPVAAAAPVQAAPRPPDATALGAALWRNKPASISKVVISVRQGTRPVYITVTASSQEALTGSLRSAGLALISAEWNTTVSLAATNDPYDAQMWGLRNTRAEQVWATATSPVTVAVLDTGVAVHSDLNGQVLAGRSILGGAISTNVTDVHGHGTHVAGTIAAVANNGLGIAGVAPNAKILPVKVLNDSGTGFLSDVASGIVYAADNGARVINLSLGSSSNSSAMQQACDYAASKGVVLVAAAGNGGPTASPNFPAADPNDNVIAVAAINSSEAAASFSQTGSYVDIAAPGVGIVSTVPGNSYSTYQGTSMASPHVAAVAALAIGKSPASSAAEIRAAVLAGARDLGASGRDNVFGAGAVDAVGTLSRLNSTTTTTTTPATSTTTTVPRTTTTTVPRTTTTTVPRTTTTTVPRTTTTTVAPTLAAPGNFRVTISDTHLTLTASSVRGASSYQLARNGAVIATSTRPSFSDLGRALIAGSYTYTMRAVTSTNVAGNTATKAFVVTPPGVPTRVSSSVVRRSLTVTVALSADTRTWQLLRNGSVVATNSASRTTIRLSQPAGDADYSLRALSLTGATNSTATFPVTILR